MVYTPREPERALIDIDLVGKSSSIEYGIYTDKYTKCLDIMYSIPEVLRSRADAIGRARPGDKELRELTSNIPARNVHTQDILDMILIESARRGYWVGYLIPDENPGSRLARIIDDRSGSKTDELTSEMIEDKALYHGQLRGVCFLACSESHIAVIPSQVFVEQCLARPR